MIGGKSLAGMDIAMTVSVGCDVARTVLLLMLLSRVLERSQVGLRVVHSLFPNCPLASASWYGPVPQSGLPPPACRSRLMAGKGMRFMEGRRLL